MNSTESSNNNNKMDSPLTRADVDRMLNVTNGNKLDLSGRNLRGIDLSNFDLDHANLSRADLTTANLSGADLSGADLQNAILCRANLDNANLSLAKLNQADLREATLINAKMVGTKLIEANLSDADLTEADMWMAHLNKAQLLRTNLTESSLISAELIKAQLQNANLTKTNLSSAKLTEADLTEAILSEKNLEDTDLRRAILSEKALEDVKLSNTKIRGATFGEGGPDKAPSSRETSKVSQGRYVPPPVLGAIGTSGLNRREVIETYQIEQLAQANPANIQEVAATQIPIGNRYYESVLQQSQRSFQAALILSIIGTPLIFAAVGFLLIRQPSDLSYVSLAGGAILDGIAGLNFYLYGRASALLVTFQTPLDRIGRFLLANSVCENLEGDVKNVTRAKLVEIIANVQTNASNEKTADETAPHILKSQSNIRARTIRRR